MNVVEIVFSPTGGTLKAADIIAHKWSENITQIDLCSPETDFSSIKIKQDDMVVIAMPSFGGRAPYTAIERLKKIQGNSARCTIVCAYGNRAFEDSLVEMQDAAKEAGFKVIAAVAAIAQHSIMSQYATDRPDAADEKQLSDFAAQILNKDQEAKSIPGNRPYKKSGGASLVPRPTKDCTKCGICAKQCPVKAIDPLTIKADSKKCISCMRCVKICPDNARKINDVMVKIAAMAIKKACSVRKDNELFI